MTYSALKSIALTVAVCAIPFAASNAYAASAQLDCKLHYSLTGWSAIYKHAEGSGTVTCANGATMAVDIAAKGGGLTVGKFHIDDGTGAFTDVHSIDEVLGDYVQGEAHAGVGKAGHAQVLTKGTVSLALAGTGEGVDIGIAVGKFTLKRAGSK
ncbi:MAG TPA: hypothetical protein VFN13_06015 [Rudaea sp.]|nr:hypothetical protein [Rudaea sp.]